MSNLNIDSKARMMEARKRGAQTKTRRTQDAIIGAVESLMLQGGIRECTVKSIGELAGVSSGTFYYQYGNVEDVVAILCERWLDELDEEITTYSYDHSLRETIAKFVEASMRGQNFPYLQAMMMNDESGNLSLLKSRRSLEDMFRSYLFVDQKEAYKMSSEDETYVANYHLRALSDASDIPQHIIVSMIYRSVTGK